MYNLGIARKAEPLDHLKKRYEDFQRRMLAAPLFPPPPSPPQSNGIPMVGCRAVLGESTTSLARRPLVTMPDVFTAPQPNARLQIFVDPTGEAAQQAAGNDWPDLGTRTSRTKENMAKVHKMDAGPLPGSRRSQRSVSGPARGIVPFRDPPTRGSFVPFRDEDDTAAMPPPDASSKRIAFSPGIEPFRGQASLSTPKAVFTPYKDEVCCTHDALGILAQCPSGFRDTRTHGGVVHANESWPPPQERTRRLRN